MNDSELSPKFLLKDQLFNQHKVVQIAGEIHGVYATFAQDDFVRAVDDMHALPWRTCNRDPD